VDYKLIKKLESVPIDRMKSETTDGLNSYLTLDRYSEALHQRYLRARIYQYSDFPFESFYIPPRLKPLKISTFLMASGTDVESKRLTHDTLSTHGIEKSIIDTLQRSLEQYHNAQSKGGYLENVSEIDMAREALLRIMKKSGVTENEISDIAPYVEEEFTVPWVSIFTTPGIKCLVGGAGYGKSLFLQNIVLNYKQLDSVFDGNRYLVIFGDLKAILKGGQQTTVVDFLQSEMLKATGISTPTDFIQQYIDNGRCIVLLDAVDEIPSEHRQSVMKMVMAFWGSENPGNKVCLTSRSKEYIPLDANCEVFEISALWQHHIVEYIRKLVALEIFNEEDCADFVTQASHLIDNGFLRSFLILSLLIGIYKGEKTLPTTKLELYDKCVKYVSFNREKGRGERNAEQKSLAYNWKYLDLLMTDDILATLATLCKPNNSETSQEQIISALKESVTYECGNGMEAKAAINEFLRFCAERTELFVLGNTPEHYKFFHRSFFEYFCAISIADHCTDNEEIFAEIEVFEADSEVYELFCAKLMQTNKNKLRAFVEYLLIAFENGLKNGDLDVMKCAVFTRLLKWQQAVGIKSELFRILCDNAEAVVSAAPQIYHAEHIVDAIRKFDKDKEEYKAKYKDYAIADILTNVSRWEFDGEKLQPKNVFWFYTELYALYCGYETVGEFVCNILNDSNVRTHLLHSLFTSSERKRILSNIGKFKNLNSKQQNAICTQATISAPYGKQQLTQYPEEEV
jgi:hypothetical protein